MEFYILDNSGAVKIAEDNAEWRIFISNNSNRLLFRDTFFYQEHRILISTIFLGICSGLGSVPLVFETKIFFIQ